MINTIVFQQNKVFSVSENKSIVKLKHSSMNYEHIVIATAQK